MKLKQLRRLARQHLDGPMNSLGFSWDDGGYLNQLSTGVIHRMLIGLDARTNDSFQVLCGVNAALPDDEGCPLSRRGVYRGEHLTADGWSCNSGHWSCRTENEAIDSFIQISSKVSTDVVDLFSQYKTLSAAANLLHDQQHGILKAKLFLADKQPKDAISSLLNYQKRLEQPKPWDDLVESAKEKELVENLLAKIRCL